MILYLIRHGQTQANAQHLYCGSTDLSLTDAAARELMARPNYVFTEEVRFLSSGMKRCSETLELLFHTKDYEIRQEFREIDFGVFEMKSYDELKENAEYQWWIDGDNFHKVPPKGESGAQMHARILPALGRLLEEGVDTVLVTHGGVIACIMQELFPKENKNIYQWQPRPGFGYKLILQEEVHRYEKIDEFYT